ncbi:hypothetical protein KTJ32_10105 [Acinetobacter gyllenbergii]|nr:hypothetical protein [Acinetobacter gyllenbergii]
MNRIYHVIFHKRLT